MPTLNNLDPACPVGLRIFKQIPRLPPEQVDRFAEAGVGDISDVLHGTGVLEAGLKSIYPSMGRVCGQAVTVDLAPGDGLLLRAAIDSARPGDIIVANAHGVTERAVLGGVIAMHMVHRGVRGLIVDGAVRDVTEIRALGLPVWSRAVTPRSGSTSNGWGEVNVPIACGGAVVQPGDIVIGDDEGLVVVPRLWAERVADTLGKAGHPPYDPSSISARLSELPPDAPVFGMDRLLGSLRERGGVVIDATYQDCEK